MTARARRMRYLAASLTAALGTAAFLTAASSPAAPRSADAIEARIPVAGGSLYSRAVGQGQPLIVLHGGPDFDHGYLLPELDLLSDTARLIYYDQRGRGRSAPDVRPDAVTLASDLDDLDRVRQHYRLQTTALLGHSWGAVLALEYALRHPARVSRLILMNPAPVSAADLAQTQAFYLEKVGRGMDRQKEIMASRAYQHGDPAAVTDRYRIHFRPALKDPEHYEALMTRMEAAFRAQGNEGIVKARAIEERLMRDTLQATGYDLLPALRRLRVPTLVITGAHDFIPAAAARHIAEAIPGAQLVVMPQCGHFVYLECPAELRTALQGFAWPAAGPRP